MVGRDEGSGDNGQDVSGLRGVSEGSGMQQAGTGILNGGDQVLAQRAWPFEGASCGCFARKAFTKAEFYDAIGGGPFPLGCSLNSAPCEILYCRMVHGITA
jgi:hypothetical protein